MCFHVAKIRTQNNCVFGWVLLGHACNYRQSEYIIFIFATPSLPPRPEDNLAGLSVLKCDCQNRRRIGEPSKQRRPPLRSIP
jgi:hypothetical protein